MSTGRSSGSFADPAALLPTKDKPHVKPGVSGANAKKSKPTHHKTMSRTNLQSRSTINRGKGSTAMASLKDSVKVNAAAVQPESSSSSSCLMDPNEFDERQSYLLPTSSSSKAFNYRRIHPPMRP